MDIFLEFKKISNFDSEIIFCFDSTGVLNTGVQFGELNSDI